MIVKAHVRSSLSVENIIVLVHCLVQKLIVAIVFLVSLCFLIFIVFILFLVSGPQLLQCPYHRSFFLSVCLFVCVFFFVAKPIK